MTPSGLVEAARFDPLATDPAVLGAALGVPETVQLADGGAVITMAYTLDGEDQAIVDERFDLELRDARGIAGVPQPLPGERVYLARLPKPEIVRMRQTQKRILALKDEAREGSGSFAVGFGFGCVTKSPLERLPVRTFIQMRSGGPYVQTTRSADMLTEMPPSRRDQLLAAFTPCGVEGER